MKVLIADDHEVLRRGLKAILADEFPKLRVTEAGNAQEALEAARQQSWDIALLDIKMPGRSGLEVLEELKRLHPKMPVLIISAFPEEEYALRAFKLGALGYVSKEGASDELLAAVRKALAGGRYVTPLLAEKLAATLSGETPITPHETLSNRELEVLRLIAAGKTLKEVAAELNLSEKTVGTYRLRISKKMSLSTNVELARYALQHKLVD
jgi:two-component system, NarL family, invasion response regulator UvrY